MTDHGGGKGGGNVFQEIFKTALEIQDWKVQQREAFFAAASDGNITAMKDYMLRQTRGSERLASEQQHVMRKLIGAPQKFNRLFDVFDALVSHKFDFEDFFENEENDIGETDFWYVRAHQPTEDAARMAGVLMAEYLRFKLIRQDDYKYDLTETLANADGYKDFLEQAKKEGSLSAVLQDAAYPADTAESFVAAQNALVDHVAAEGDHLPMHRGAAFLRVMAAEHPTLSRLWTIKMTGIRKVEAYHLAHGDLVRYEPQFS